MWLVLHSLPHNKQMTYVSSPVVHIFNWIFVLHISRSMEEFIIQPWPKLWSANEKSKLWFKLLYLKVKNSGVNINNNNQYLVCPPFALITAFIRFCILLTKLLQVVESIFSYSSWSLASNAFFDEHLCILSLFPKWDHKFSMGFRSGDWGGHFITVIPFFLKRTFWNFWRMAWSIVLLKD